MRGFLLVFLLLTSFAGCLSGDGDDRSGGDDGDGSIPGGNETVYELPATVTGMEFVTRGNETGSTGFWIHDNKAYLSGSEGLRIVDITIPSQPVLLAGEVENTTSTRDVEVFVHPNNRTYAVMAKGAGTVDLIDVTDPTAPFWVTQAGLPGVHTVAVVPNSTIVYNSRSISAHTPGVGETGQIDIIDFADPENPVVKVFVFPAVVMTVGGVP